MVNQNYVLYVNEKRILRSAKIALTQENTNHNIKFSIPEKHLICGLILKGMPVKGDRLRDFPFKPIEKYLFEFSNIHFIIPDLEYTVENSDYNFNVAEVEDILSLIAPLSVTIVSVNSYGVTFTSGEGVFVLISYDGINYQEVGNEGASGDQRTNYQPNSPDCYFKLSNYARTLFSEPFHYIPAGGVEPGAL
jgi:hypothetical protein